MIAKAQKEKSERLPRKNDPDATKENILKIASEEFVASGFSGARVDEIAERTKTSKRMLYYYFGSKEGLYLAVLENAFRSIRALESGLHLEDMAPEDAMRKLIESTFDHDDANPDFVRLISIENIHRAEHMETAPWRASTGSIFGHHGANAGGRKLRQARLRGKFTPSPMESKSTPLDV